MTKKKAKKPKPPTFPETVFVRPYDGSYIVSTDVDEIYDIEFPMSEPIGIYKLVEIKTLQTKVEIV